MTTTDTASDGMALHSHYLRRMSKQMNAGIPSTTDPWITLDHFLASGWMVEAERKMVAEEAEHGEWCPMCRKRSKD